MRTIFAFASLLILSACFYNPSPMPIGSAKAHEKYKSPDGPEPKPLEARNSAQAQSY